MLLCWWSAALPQPCFIIPFSDLIERQIDTDHRTVYQQMLENTNDIYEEAVRFGYQISADSVIQGYLDKEDYPSLVAELFAKKEIVNYLTQMRALSQTLSSYALIKDGEVEVWTEIPFWDKASSDLMNDWYQNIAEQNETFGKTPNISKPYSFVYQGQNGLKEMQYISISIPLYSARQPRVSHGILVININTEEIEKIMEKGSASFDEAAFITGKKEFRSGKKGTETEQGKETLFEYSEETKLGGTLVCSIHDSNLLLMSWNVAGDVVVVLALIAVLTLAMLIPMMLYITRPVKKLTGAMQRVGKGDLNTRVEIHTKDEFETLGTELNRMIERLDNVLQKTLQNEKDRYDLEYEVLVAQINPHFIYNTLNTVIYLARKERNQDVIHITKALIELLQDGIKLQDNKMYSTIEEELTIIKNYCCIQNYRYQDKFTLETQCPEELLQQKIPTSVIQPLVENALFHGIVPMDGHGTITLRMEEMETEQKHYLLLSVIDDGIGIPEEKKRDILEGRLTITDASRNHIGLGNIKKRLDLLYGDEYRMEFTDGEENGTKVTLKISL